ncbi:hypothetical protein PYW08_000181 [Mythimna loreyi]|uniref:Uncharacterized protein n=1 Tax=Mythimna loreyi TaxID=667449 RepID=A0ACC2RC01_9NEOP|nr:hypothetical protein PYW08_000181 [Mythimna loreyi]
MVRKYKKKGTRTQDVDEESIKLAVDVIHGRLSYRKAALKYNIKTSTLESRVKKFKEGSQAESSISPIDFETDEETDDRSIHNNLNVTPEKIKDDCFVLVKFEKKTSVVYYVGKVLSHYSGTELKISYLRKKSGSSWSFFFPVIEGIHTLYISDVAMILPVDKLYLLTLKQPWKKPKFNLGQ